MSDRHKQPEPRRWVVPMLWVVVPAGAAVMMGLWQQQHPPRPSLPRPRPPLTLTGDARRDRRAILERAADLLLPRHSTTPTAGSLFDGSPLVEEIGLELLPLDPVRGAECVRHSMGVESTGSPEATYDLDAPERSSIGRLVRLARSLRPYPALADEALRTAYDEAQQSQFVEGRIEALCAFALEAARLDPVRASSAVQQAEAAAALLPRNAPTEPLAAVAAAVARVRGAAAVRPLVERALQRIPTGPARPLVEARLAVLLATAAPRQASALAGQAVADVARSGARASAGLGGPQTDAEPPKTSASGSPRYFGMDLPSLRAAERRTWRAPTRPQPRPSTARWASDQYRALAITLAASHPEAALAAISRIPAPGASEVQFRRAVRAAELLPSGQKRRSALIAAAAQLSGFTFLPAPIPMFQVSVPRLAPPPPGAHPATGNPSRPLTAAAVDVNLPAEVASQPDPGRALAMAERAENTAPVLSAEALLTVARRLRRGEASRLTGTADRELEQRPPRSPGRRVGE